MLVIVTLSFSSITYASKNEYYPHYYTKLDPWRDESLLSMGNREYLNRDYAKAVKFYKESNIIEAKTNLAMLYFEGLGVRQNTETAIEILLIYADQKYNNAIAQYNLGVIYYEARPDLYGNVKKAKEWFGKSCDNGMTKACKAYNEI